MKIHFNPKDFLRKFKIASTIALGKDVKPILQNVKIVADKKIGAVLMATDTTTGIRIRVDADVSVDGEALLPAKRFLKILETAKERLTLESTETGIAVTGERNQWAFHAVSPDEFPNVDEFSETAYHEIPAKTLCEVIERTMFATDKENPRYSLAGVCFESDGDKITAVSTCGRRLATQVASGKCVKRHKIEPAILPVNSLKLLTKVLKDTPASGDVKMAVRATIDEEKRTTGTAHFQYGDVTIFSRFVEGRFPKWRAIMPEKDGRLHAQVRSETLRTALDRIITTKTEPGVLFDFRRGGLTLESRAKESGQSKVSIPITCNETADFILDVSFMKDYLRVLDADTALDIFISPDNDPVLFETGDGDYRYLVMPMKRDEPAIAEPEADTGDEVVGKVSTEEAPMENMDESPCSDNELETKVFQLLQENDQLQAKVEHYQALLDRAMRVIGKMKADQCVCA
jgi:DNA polymerase-3 subunit beta